MALNSEFTKAVADERMWEVYQRLADIMPIDPSLRTQDEMLQLAEQSLPNLYQEHDGDQLRFSSSDWDEGYYAEQKYRLEKNFSRERLDLLRRMTKHQYADTIKYRAEQQREREAEKRHTQAPIVTAKRIGGVAVVAGTVVAVSGVAASSTAATIAGAVVAVGGIAVVVACSPKK